MSQPKPLTDFEKKMLKQQVEETRRLEKIINTAKFAWHSKSIDVIKDKLAARKKLNLYNGNDWKVRFYEEKLSLKPKIISRLARLI